MDVALFGHDPSPEGNRIESTRHLSMWPTLYVIGSGRELHSFDDYEATRGEIFRYPRESNGYKFMTEKEVSLTKNSGRRPEHYALLTPSGKRRARARMVDIRELRKPFQEMRPFPDREYIFGTYTIRVDLFCMTCLQHFDCGHSYRSLCLNCDPYGSGGLSVPTFSCPLHTMIFAGAWKPKRFVNFWPTACGLCHTLVGARQSQPLDLDLRLQQFRLHLWNQLYADQSWLQRSFLAGRAKMGYTEIEMYRSQVLAKLWAIRMILYEESKFWLGTVQDQFVDTEDLEKKILDMVRAVARSLRMSQDY